MANSLLNFHICFVIASSRREGGNLFVIDTQSLHRHDNIVGFKYFCKALAVNLNRILNRMLDLIDDPPGSPATLSH